MSRCEFPGGDLGIALYLIVSVDAEGKEEDDQFRSFQGRQFTCSIDNCNPQCLRDGLWKLHRPNGLTHTEKVFDWEIISYFPTLNANHRIPSEVCTRIEDHGRYQNLFGPA